MGRRLLVAMYTEYCQRVVADTVEVDSYDALKTDQTSCQLLHCYQLSISNVLCISFPTNCKILGVIFTLSQNCSGLFSISEEGACMCYTGKLNMAKSVRCIAVVFIFQYSTNMKD